MALRAERTVPALLSRRLRRVDYRSILVPLHGGADATHAMTIACRLAAERHSSVTALAVIEVPAELPLEAHMLDAQAKAKRVLGDAVAVGDLHGVDVVQKVVRARAAGEAVVDAAAVSGSEIIVLAASRRVRPRARVFGSTVDFVLKHAPCRVMVAAR
jgi:basic amino acid/polyamine antiporter, APA family